ncbi:TPA: chromosome segregation protein SMC [Bacillus tropicus]|uniref:hypothetical protein n=1 Tax=Bacillus tropicus TaxID=2026188 RepID=UPI00003CC594|nr:hypothetical protein [Bacillus tropicus]AIY76924.1 sMC1-family ATPase involved in DNA repair [Bacillus cereus]AJI07151.1 sMC1-family ATPase involved in DNA repair [Bacillus cereus G9241]ARO17210.1 chromosome segregation protein SMC [Bacillus cereus]EAL11108.1 SMC1-family ATPase involved in DNA repair, putative [Bacillus cereus G9241]KDB44041.1 chromosome segregation protein SMC [Bacillus cereus]
MATEREIELAKQILNKVTAMEKKVDKLDGRVSSLESKVDDLKNVHTGLQATFEKGFSDVRNKLDDIIELNNNRKSAREIVESITGKEDK